MESRRVLDGIFEVTREGQVYRIRDGMRRIAKQTSVGRNGKYKIVTYYKDGKQKHEYVHRLVAAAFCPNPEGKPIINHIDGNPENNRAENLEWCTHSENIQHAYRIGLKDPYKNAVPCRRCGRLTRAAAGICPQCRKAAKIEAGRIERAARMRKEMEEIDFLRITRAEAEAAALRAQGMTYEEIARRMGETRQSAWGKVSRARIRSLTPKKPSKAVTARIEALGRRRARKDARIHLLREEIRSLGEEIERIDAEVKELSILPDKRSAGQEQGDWRECQTTDIQQK